MPSFKSVVSSLPVILTALPSVQAGLDLSSTSNVVVYWGQNSAAASGGGPSQQPLATYCEDPNIDTLVMAFMTRINGAGGVPEINLANIGDSCGTFDGTNLKDCPQVGEDIKKCQSLGKTILLSIGGATYTEGGFQSAEAAEAGARMVWETFGPVTNGDALRPFGDAVVDGFDLDFEATVSNMVPFANTLRSLMDSDSSKQYFLTAAPQCPFPDAANKEMLDGAVSFDAIWVQFYNNYCGVNSYPDNFNFNTWDDWAQNTSKNKNVKVLVGVPANTGAAGSGYLPVDQLAPVIEHARTFPSFGGVMMWDASQAYANDGFLSGIKSILGSVISRVKRMFFRRDFW
ncbi:hypothetical protein VTN49DRAFT_5191 [Thermomyces lanuginosus]|uniref:chitinase n=1 Tax=Thermomyces lanuginosus TaxID=5541 RepID=A0A0A0RVU7_THELA|nr:chitinase 2 [Thermomyces lanuginosus]